MPPYLTFNWRKFSLLNKDHYSVVKKKIKRLSQRERYPDEKSDLGDVHAVGVGAGSSAAELRNSDDIIKDTLRVSDSSLPLPDSDTRCPPLPGMLQADVPPSSTVALENR